jgi:transcriptional regulator
MYIPPQFSPKAPQMAGQLMREFPFASLITSDDQGLPFVTHLPLHWEEGSQRLYGHCAKSNPHWKHLAARPQSVVTFLGPQAYMSPRVYPDFVRVPTWNYLAVHVTVTAQLIQDSAPKELWLKALIADHEPAYAAQWQDLPEDYTQKMLQAIVGFELQAVEIQCKLKLNQHRPESHQAMYKAYAQSEDSSARDLARWMERLGMVS